MIVDFKFDVLYSKSSLRASQVSRKVNRKFVLVGGAVCAIPTLRVLPHCSVHTLYTLITIWTDVKYLCQNIQTILLLQ